MNGWTWIVIWFSFWSKSKYFKLFSISSTNNDEDFILPEPSHVGHFSCTATSVSGLTLWRVICMRPNFVAGRIVCLALSFDISSLSLLYNSFLLAASCMSIKSTIIIPPISRRRSWRAISFAASKFTDKAFSSWEFSLLTRWPLFTSITCIASVCSTMR